MKAKQRLYLYAELKTLGIQYSKMHLSRLEKSGKFPRRTHLNGSGRCAWIASELDKWISSQAAYRK